MGRREAGHGTWTVGWQVDAQTQAAIATPGYDAFEAASSAGALFFFGAYRLIDAGVGVGGFDVDLRPLLAWASPPRHPP